MDKFTTYTCDNKANLYGFCFFNKGASFITAG